MRKRMVLSVLFLSIMSAPLLHGRAAGGALGLYLEIGAGIRDKLEIGKQSRLTQAQTQELNRLYGLEFNFGAAKGSKVISNIKCDKPGCVTDRNVGIGSSLETVMQRFGAPMKKRRFAGKNSELFIYDGVALMIKNKQVTVIYILPR